MNGLFISKKKYHCLALWASLLACLHGCKIENDIPYPTVTGDILSFEVEGQCASPDNGSTAATINTTERTVTLYVDDTVDLTQLRIRRFTVSNDATILADEAACTDFALFPTQGFETPDNLADTRVNFTQPVRFTLQTYQNYVWTVSVTQLVDRTIDIVGQVRAVVDVENRTAIIYVAEGQDLHNLQVNRMDLGGASGKVVPDPTALHDFSAPRTFQVTQGWEEVAYEWTVFVYNDSGDTSASTEAAPMSTGARVSGSIESGKTPVVEYREAGTEAWTELPASAVTVSGTQFTAQLIGLAPATTYEYRIVIDDTPGAQLSFTTAPATPLTNGGFEDWSSEPANNGTMWWPWAAGGESFWDTGNRGATTIGDSNSVPTDDTSNGSGRAAMLQSKWSVLKLAAGNIFTGSYVRTDGTNGILSFGRPFTAFPTALRFHYKYTSSTINRIGEDAMEHLRGLPDSCHVYIALSDRSEPYEIRTRPSERQLFDKNDPNIIAYAEFITGQSTGSYRQIDLPLTYRYYDRAPQQLIIVASASKYGDYFTGGDSSTLWLDEMELVYE